MNTPAIDALSYSGYPLSSRNYQSLQWLYFRFALSYLDAADIMAERGDTVSYETIRESEQLQFLVPILRRFINREH